MTNNTTTTGAKEMTKQERIETVNDAFTLYNKTGYEVFLTTAIERMAAWNLTADDLDSDQR